VTDADAVGGMDIVHLDDVGGGLNDLLDANETIWAFVVESSVDCTLNVQVSELVVLVTESLGKFCCGLTAD
jgi:hypothetical protein